MEDEITIKYMKEQGWKYVRGGQFSNPNDLTIYNKLLGYQRKHSLDFIVNEPETIPPEHITTIYRGMNKSKVKINVFKNFDLKDIATIKASISGTFNSKTAQMTYETLVKVEIHVVANEWLEKHSCKFEGILSEDVFAQYRKLKNDKLLRLK